MTRISLTLGLLAACLVALPAAAEEQPAAQQPQAVEPQTPAPTPPADTDAEDEAFLKGTEEKKPEEQKPEEQKPETPKPPPEQAEEAAAPDEAKPQDADQSFLTDTEKPEIEAPIKEEDVDLGRAEDPKKAYYSLGGRFRWLMLPEWFISMFGVDVIRPSGKNAAIPVISRPAAGLEFTYRKAALDIIAAVWWADISWDETLVLKGNDEDHNSWEVTENDMQALFFTADFIWSKSFTDWVAITYGLGAGLGVRFGEVLQTEATHASGHTEKCLGEADPDIDCQPDEEYGSQEPTVEKFVVFPWINFLLGFRFKPHRNVAINIDGGFGFGFQVGARIGYIF